MTKTAAKSAPSALDLVAGMAGKQKKAAKPGKPEVNDPALDEQIATFIEQKAIADTATALRDAAKQQIISTANPERLKACVRDGKVHASITVNGRLTMTQQKRYSNVAEEHTDDLAETFADDFPRFFKATLGISLAEGSANDEQILQTLIDKLGAEFFAEHFVVRRDLVVQEAFHNAYSTDAKVQQKAAPFIAQRAIAPYSPSLKIK